MAPYEIQDRPRDIKSFLKDAVCLAEEMVTRIINPPHPLLLRNTADNLNRFPEESS